MPYSHTGGTTRRIAVILSKGGVGKTTTAVSLSHALALDGARATGNHRLAAVRWWTRRLADLVRPVTACQGTSITCREARNVKITDEVAQILRSYVYVYIDPRNGEPFYIGKGKGNRLFAHLGDPTDTDKVARIADIRASGYEPRIDILRYGLSDSEAALVEAAAIDLLGKANLTNVVAGYHAGSYGRITSQELVTMLTARPAVVRHKAMLININRLYRSDMTALELYEATRGIWVVGLRRHRAEYAMAVYQGIVREVYCIEQWHTAGTLKYETRSATDFVDRSRWEFSGHIAGDIRNEYVGFSVGRGGRNPIRYMNV